MNADRALVTKIVYSGRGLAEARAAGVTPDKLVHEDLANVLAFMEAHEAKYGKAPSPPVVLDEFPDVMWEPTDEGMPFLIDRWLASYERREVIEFVREKLAPATNDPEYAGKLRELLLQQADRLEGVSNGNGAAGEIVWASTIDAEVVEWYWAPWIARASLTLIQGDPKVGKGLFSAWCAACATKGRHGFPKSRVGFLGHEDSLGIMRGRMDAQGVRAEDVGFLRKRNGSPLSFPSDADTLRELIATNGLDIVFIDPFDNHVDEGVNTNSNREIRSALSPLALVAQETGCAIVIVNHMSKSGQGGKLQYRALGSIGYGGVVRAQLAIGEKQSKDEDDDPNLRYLFHVTSNYAATQQAVELRIEETDIVVKGVDRQTVRLVWVGDTEVSEDEIFGSPKGPGRPRNEEVREWVAEYIDGKAVIVPSDLKDAAEAEGYGRQWGTIRHVVKVDHGYSDVKQIGSRDFEWRKPDPADVFLKQSPEAAVGEGNA